MVAQSATAQQSGPRTYQTITQLAYVLTLATAAMMLLLALWLLARRISGHLQSPLAWPQLAAVAVTLVGLGSLLRVVWGSARTWRAGFRLSAMLLWAVPTIAIGLLATALSIAGTGRGQLLFFWSILFGSECAWGWYAWRQIRARSLSRAPGQSDRSTVPRNSTSDPPAAELDEGDETIPEDVYQQLTRWWVEQEKDTVDGLLRARLAPGERSQSLHVAFCPPMLWRPDVTVIQLSGPGARIKPGDVQPFGVRFDVRLTASSDEAQDVLIHFEARCGKPPIAGVGGIHGE